MPSVAGRSGRAHCSGRDDWLTGSPDLSYLLDAQTENCPPETANFGIDGCECPQVNTFLCFVSRLLEDEAMFDKREHCES